MKLERRREDKHTQANFEYIYKYCGQNKSKYSLYLAARSSHAVKATGSSALVRRSQYLAEVPRARADLLLRAVVDPPRVVQDVLLPLVLVIQKHCVLCKDTTESRL